MPEIVMKMLADQPLAIEPKDSSDVVESDDGTGPLNVLAGHMVKTGAKDSIKETLNGGREITWVFVEAIDGDNADKKKGFVPDRFLVAEGTAVPMSAGFQPFGAAVDKAVFAEACYVQAVLNKTNPAYLYALAFVLSGDKWSATQVQTSDPEGVFRFPQETWKALLSEPELAGLQPDQIKFPNAQCIVAAVLAAKSANLLQGLVTDRGLSAVDLLLAHLFADDNSFGSNAAASILQAEKDDKTQKADDFVKAHIYPDNAVRAAFFHRNADIFKTNGSATIEEALQACTDELAAGFDDVAAVAKKLKSDADLKDCQVAGVDGTIPKGPREPVSGGGGGGAPGVGGGVIQSQQNGVRNKSIPDGLHDILEYAGRKTGIDVEIYSGGQAASGPNRVGSHRHDVNAAGTLPGAADLYMLDARTRRVLDSNNQDDRKRMADLMTASAAAGATGIGHAPGYMGTKSTHIGGGDEAVWGAGNVRAGAPQWVITAFESGRANKLSKAAFAAVLAALRTTPVPVASNENVEVLATLRQRFVGELADAEIHRLIAASANAEVGGQGPKAEQYYIESVFNRAVARNETLKQTATDSAYYPPTTLNKLDNPVQPAKQTQIDGIIAGVVAGANESNFATGNESGGVHSDGAPVTRDLGPGKERFVQENPDKKWIAKVAAAAARGDTNLA